jgi:hypothetical protein
MIRLSWSLSPRRHIPYASSYYFLRYYRGVNESTQNFYLKLSIFCLFFPLYILFCLIVYSQGQHQEFKLEGQVDYHHGTEAGGPTYYFRQKRNIRSWIQYVFFSVFSIDDSISMTNSVHCLSAFFCPNWKEILLKVLCIICCCYWSIEYQIDENL